MKVGFYNHIGVVDGAEGLRVPRHFGMLLEGIAREAGELVFYGHRRPAAGNEDHVLSPAVRFVDLGPARTAIERTVHPGPALRRLTLDEDELDAMIVQGPSPLLPGVVRAAGDLPLAILLGGDYGTWRPRPSFPAWRNIAIGAWIRLYRVLQRRASRGRLVLLQNPTLASTVDGADRIEIVPLSSIEAGSLPPAPDPIAVWPEGRGRTEPVRLVYSGRIVREKGLFEAVESLRILADRGYRARLDLVGWEDAEEPILDDLIALAGHLGVPGGVRSLGYRPAGPELLSVYADADVFVLPTYGDSVPRSMQEAMAMGVPAVASAVGGIEHYLEHRRTALLIEPGSAEAVADAVQELIEQPELRRTVAEQGCEWARSYTNDASCALIVRHLRERI